MWDGIDSINGESMGREFCEGRLGKEDGEVAIVMALPCEGCAEEPVDRAHEVDHDPLLEGFHESSFLERICGVKNKIVNVDAYVYSSNVGGGRNGSGR